MRRVAHTRGALFLVMPGKGPLLFMPKFRINCPEGVHKGYKKLLLGIDVSNGEIKRVYIHCPDMKCRTWFELQANGEMVKLKRMPKDYHFDFKHLPALVVDHGNT